MSQATGKEYLVQAALEVHESGTVCLGLGEGGGGRGRSTPLSGASPSPLTRGSHDRGEGLEGVTGEVLEGVSRGCNS